LHPSTFRSSISSVRRTSGPGHSRSGSRIHFPSPSLRAGRNSRSCRVCFRLGYGIGSEEQQAECSRDKHVFTRRSGAYFLILLPKQNPSRCYGWVLLSLSRLSNQSAKFDRWRRYRMVFFHSFSNPWLVNFSVRAFSVTVRTICLGTPWVSMMGLEIRPTRDSLAARRVVYYLHLSRYALSELLGKCDDDALRTANVAQEETRNTS
jgi:hypothetical protein